MTGIQLTWEPPDPGEWEFDGSHQHSLASATIQMLMPPAFREGFRRTFARFGLPISHMELRYVNGWAYMSAFVHGAPRKGSGKPPPGLVVKLLTRVPPSARKRIKVAAAAIEGRLAVAEVDRWMDLRPSWIEKNLAVQDVDVAAGTDAELVDHLRATANHAADGMTLHFDLIGQSLALGEYLLRLDDWGIDRGVGAKAAFHGVPSTIESRERIDAIVAALGDTPVTSLDQISAHSTEAAAALDEFLRYHGGWVLGDDVDGATLVELPAVVARTIEQARTESADEAAAVAAAVAACREQIPTADRSEFDLLLADAQRAYAALDDNSGITASWPMGLLRRALVEAAKRLVGLGVLLSEDETWALTPAEIAALLNGSNTPDRAEIDRRIELRAAQAVAVVPPRLGSPPSPPPDPSLFPAPVGQNVRHMFAFIAAKFGDHATPAIGVGDAAATGRAVVARSADEAIARVEPGDILVTVCTTPAFNTVMALLGGVVTIGGGPNSHTAIVAREFGIPAVIGLTDALETIPDGAMVRIDPVAASVTVTG